MDTKDIQRVARKVMTGQVAGRNTDPAFYSALNVLPDPNPILRAMGKADQVYDAIMMDAHVMGELRSVRAGVISHKLRVVAGDSAPENAKQTAVLELCQSVLNRNPAPGVLWQDLMWNMATAVFKGRRHHEVVWSLEDSKLLPTAILDRPNRRFVFDSENNLRLLTKTNSIDGEETEPYQWLTTRHMPSTENPYGQAVLASCYWPYTFKHGGWKFFYQFCERFGLPLPIGKYPAGTPINEQQGLVDALVDMISAGAGAIPNDDTVELHSVSHSGELAQEALIHLCNREMSKALTSQTLATEMKNVGSNAASVTHQERQNNVQDSDRAIIEATMNELFANITLFNFGDDVVPPVFQLFKPKKVDKERADIWDLASRIGNPSKKAFHTEMNIPEAEDEDDRLRPAPQQSATNFNAAEGMQFSQKEPSHLDNVITAADEVIENDLIEPAYQMLLEYEEDGKTLQQFLDDLPNLFGSLNEDQLTDLNSQVLQHALANGAANV